MPLIPLLTATGRAEVTSDGPAAGLSSPASRVGAPMRSTETKRPRRAPAAVSLLGALLLASGCGGDEETDSTSSTAASGTQPAAELVAQADAICADANERRAGAPTFSGGGPTAGELRDAADYFAADLRITQDAYDQLVELAPPEGLEAPWNEVLNGFDEGVIGNYPDLIAAAREGDKKSFLAVLQQIQTDSQGLPEFAAEIGLQVCASPD